MGLLPVLAGGAAGVVGVGEFGGLLGFDTRCRARGSFRVEDPLVVPACAVGAALVVDWPLVVDAAAVVELDPDVPCAPVPAVECFADAGMPVAEFEPDPPLTVAAAATVCGEVDPPVDVDSVFEALEPPHPANARTAAPSSALASRGRVARTRGVGRSIPIKCVRMAISPRSRLDKMNTTRVQGSC